MSIWHTPTLWESPIHDDHKYTFTDEAIWDTSNDWNGAIECHPFTTITAILLLYDTLWKSYGIRSCDLLLRVIFNAINARWVVGKLKLPKEYCSQSVTHSRRSQLCFYYTSFENQKMYSAPDMQNRLRVLAKASKTRSAVRPLKLLQRFWRVQFIHDDHHYAFYSQ